MEAKFTPGPWWLHCANHDDKPIAPFTPSWDQGRGMLNVGGEFARTFAEAREAKAARAAIAKALGA